MTTPDANDAGRLAGLRRQARLRLDALGESYGFATPAAFRAEILITAAVCLFAAGWAAYLFSQFEFVRLCRGFDLWFDSDPARTIANITSRTGQFHERSILHPLYSLFIAAPFNAIGTVLGLRTSTLAMLYVGVQSACYAGGAYVAMRAFGLMRLDALLGVALLYSTAAAIYWIGFPEWIGFGAAAVLVSAIWVATPARVRTRASDVTQNLISACMVVTSWAVGALASLVADWPQIRWRQAFLHTVYAGLIIAGLWVVQLIIFPSTWGGFWNFLFEVYLRFVKTYPDVVVRRPLLGLTTEFFGQTLLAPSAAVIEGPRNVPGWGALVMTGQRQPVPITALTSSVLLLWFALWALGILAALRGGVSRAVALFVVGALGFFYVLHMVFGGEVFLFSLHFASFMTFIALWSVRSHYKAVSRALCVALIAASMAYNYPAFKSAVAIHNAIDLSWLDRDHAASDAAAKLDCR